MRKQIRDYNRLVETRRYLEVFYRETEEEASTKERSSVDIMEMQMRHRVTLAVLDRKIENHPLHQK